MERRKRKRKLKELKYSQRKRNRGKRLNEVLDIMKCINSCQKYENKMLLLLIIKSTLNVNLIE